MLNKAADETIVGECMLFIFFYLFSRTCFSLLGFIVKLILNEDSMLGCVLCCC